MQPRFLLAIAFCLTSSHCWADEPKQPAPVLDLTPSPEVDETLFLVRKLETLTERLPTQFADENAVTAQLVAIRKDLVATQTYCRGKGLDTELIRMYDTTLEITSAYATLLNDLGTIHKSFDQQHQQKETALTSEAYKHGSDVGGALASAGANPYVAGAVLIGYAIYESLTASWSLQKIDVERQRAWEKRISEFRRRQSETVTEIRTRATLIADKRGWKPGEIGFNDLDEADTERLLNAARAGDLAFLQTRCLDLVRSRPRDPFLHASIAELTDDIVSRWFKAHPDVASVMKDQATERYLQAARLVPAGRFHNPLRAYWLLRASYSASDAASNRKGFTPLPLQLAEAARDLDPSLNSELVINARAFGLARAGRLEEAIRYLKESHILQRTRDVAYHYNLACLLSLSDSRKGAHHAEAVQELAEAIRTGDDEIRWMQQDPDLMNVRDDVHRMLFEDDDAGGVRLRNTRVKFDPGVFSSDTILQNGNAFPLTAGIVLVAHDRKGAIPRVYALPPTAIEVLSFDRIAPQQELRFKGTKLAKAEEGNDLFFMSLSHESRSSDPSPDVQGDYSGACTAQKIDHSDVYKSVACSLALRRLDNLRYSAKLLLNADGLVEAAPIQPRQIAFEIPTIFDGMTVAQADDETIQLIWNDDAVYGWMHSAADRKEGVIKSFYMSKLPQKR